MDRHTFVNASGAKMTIDRSAELFGAATTIADLAQFTFNDADSDHLTIYRAAAMLERDWGPEMQPDTMEMEYLLSVRVAFKDGSALAISAWADCCDGTGCKQCSGEH